jgi:hypothetical protein
MISTTSILFMTKDNNGGYKAKANGFATGHKHECKAFFTFFYYLQLAHKMENRLNCNFHDAIKKKLIMLFTIS